MYFLHIDLSQESGATIVMVAFSAHFIKEISRTVALSSKAVVTPRQKKFSAYEKSDFFVPLGQAFVERNCQDD